MFTHHPARWRLDFKWQHSDATASIVCMTRDSLNYDGWNTKCNTSWRWELASHHLFIHHLYCGCLSWARYKIYHSNLCVISPWSFSNLKDNESLANVLYVTDQHEIEIIVWNHRKPFPKILFQKGWTHKPYVEICGMGHWLSFVASRSQSLFSVALNGFLSVQCSSSHVFFYLLHKKYLK